MPNNMRDEIAAAVCFMARVISASKESITNISVFKECLSKELEGRFQGHWYTDVPGKGQGYRSIRIHPNEPIDPVLEAAAKESKFSIIHFKIPVELTLWIDPKDVSCRFGDIKPTFCTVLKDQDNKSLTINVEELLDAAKALYSRQQHFTVREDPPNGETGPFRYNLSISGNLDQFGFHPSLSSSPPNGYHMYGYVEGYLPSSYMYNRRMMGDGMEDSTPSPSNSSHYQASFTSTAVNTTPRKNGKGSSFRKGGNGGSGRGPKNLHHHHSNSDTAIYNHNHNNNHNSSSGNSSSSSSSSSDRFHWVRGSKHHGPKEAK